MGRLLRQFNAVTGLSGWSDPKTASLTDSPSRIRADLHTILRAGVASVDPPSPRPRCLDRGALACDSRTEPVSIVAAGKAAWPMAVGTRACTPVRCQVAAGSSPGRGSAGSSSAASVRVVRCVTSIAQRGERGGGTARAGARGGEPRHEAGCSSCCREARHPCSRCPLTGLSLSDKVLTARALMNAGVAIADLNCVRKHLSAIKGGRLAAAARSDDHAGDLRCSRTDRGRSRGDWIGPDRRRPDDVCAMRCADRAAQLGVRTAAAAVVAHLERGGMNTEAGRSAAGFSQSATK